MSEQGEPDPKPGTSRAVAFEKFRGHPVDARWRARQRMAAAARELLDQLIGVELSESEMRDATAQLERHARELAGRPHLDLPEAFARLHAGGPDKALAEVAWRLDYGPNLGFCNPIAVPIRTWQTERGTGGSVCYGVRYEGPPAFVNGGHVAAALDEVSGLSAARSGMQAMTGRLTVHYRKPTPLHRELALEGEIVHIEGRKITTAARLLDGRELLAEAEGLFIAVRTDVANPD